jgi:hypothetical protein
MGRDLLEAFVEAFPVEVGWVFATGSVDDIELKLASRGADARRAYKGHYTLAQLSGPLGGPYGVTLSRVDGERPELIAGILVRARCVAVRALCMTGSGAPVGVEAEPQRVPEPTPPPADASWAARAAHSAAVQAEPREELDATDPERGDLVSHFAFGICEVLNATGDRLLIRDVAQTGRVREILTDVLVVHPPVERDGKRLFKLTRRG